MRRGGGMAKLKNIWINTTGVSGYELRMDWDNDRHQGIKMESLDPEHVKLALRNVALMIQLEQQNKKL